MDDESTEMDAESTEMDAAAVLSVISPRETLVAALCSDGEPALEAKIAGFIASDSSTAPVDRLVLTRGPANECTVERLVRVRLDDGPDSRLAEPTPRAVIEAGVSLLRAKME